jgi:hypothetical protein
LVFPIRPSTDTGTADFQACPFPYYHRSVYKNFRGRQKRTSLTTWAYCRQLRSSATTDLTPTQREEASDELTPELTAQLDMATRKPVTNNKPPGTDPFYPVLVDCIFAAQGLIHAGFGALMFMLPQTMSYPGAPNPLDASPDVVRAFGYVLASPCVSIVMIVSFHFSAWTDKRPASSPCASEASTSSPSTSSIVGSSKAASSYDSLRPSSSPAMDLLGDLRLSVKSRWRS